MSSVLNNVSDSVAGQYSLLVWAPFAVVGYFVLKWLIRPESFKGVPEPVSTRVRTTVAQR